MNLRENFEKAKANLQECENQLIQLEAQHKEQIKHQKQLIFVARKTCRAYEELIDKAVKLEGK